MDSGFGHTTEGAELPRKGFDQPRLPTGSADAGLGAPCPLPAEAFRALFEASPSPYLILTPDLKIVAANKSYLEHTLGSARELYGRHIFDAFPDNPDDPNADGVRNLRASLERVIQTKAEDAMPVQKYDVRNRQGVFETRYWAPKNAPVLDGAGNLLYIIHRVENVTASVNVELAEKARAEKEHDFQHIADTIPQFVWITDAAGKIIFHNKRWAEYTGLTLQSSRGYLRRQVIHPADRVRWARAWHHALTTGEPYDVEFRLRGADGSYRWFLSRAVAMRNEEGKITRWLGTNTDIDDQKQAYGELLEERALRERFINMLTHDLRNPVAAAKMSAQLVLRYRDDESKRDRHLPKITEALERVDQMITDLLDANRINAGETLPLKTAPCDLRQIAVESLEELSVIHGDRFRLQADGPCVGVWSCEGLRRVIDNLAVNAVKYGASEGVINVTVICREVRAQLSVHNEGNELTPEEARALFKIFKRAKSADRSSVNGWGIGLTLVKGIVEALYGSVWAESGEGRGTTFFVELPRN